MQNTHFTLQPCTPADAPALALIGVASFLSSFVKDIHGEALIKHCQTQHSSEYYDQVLTATDPRYKCWLVHYTPTGAPIGYLMTSPPDLPVPYTPTDIELKRIYLLPEFLGLGLGKRMMEQALAYAKLCQAPRLLLGTYKENDTAVNFYKRAGFNVIGKRPFNVGGVIYDDIVMALEI